MIKLVNLAKHYGRLAAVDSLNLEVQRRARSLAFSDPMARVRRRPFVS